jgi:hypothetical protein
MSVWARVGATLADFSTALVVVGLRAILVIAEEAFPIWTMHVLWRARESGASAFCISADITVR